MGTEHVLTLQKKNRPQQHLFLVLVDAWWTEESGLDLPDCWSLAPVFYSQLKSKVGNILAKAAALRIDLKIDGAPIASRSHTHPRTLNPLAFSPRPSPSLSVIINHLYSCALNVDS